MLSSHLNLVYETYSKLVKTFNTNNRYQCPRNFDINLNINIMNIKIRYQCRYQYQKSQKSISISIPIPKIIEFKLNPKTIPKYLDILQSQANTPKIRASIADLWCKSPILKEKNYPILYKT